MVMSGWSVNLTTLFLGRLRPPKWSTTCTSKCIYFCQSFLESAEGEMIVSAHQGPLTLDQSDALPTMPRGLAVSG